MLRADHARTELAGFHAERRLGRLGYQLVAGVDEVGRGSWAGPLVAAAVMLPTAGLAVGRALDGVRDSKRLSASQRERLYARIHHVAVGVGVGVVSPRLLDAVGLSAAGQLAMAMAVRRLPRPPDFVLSDAFTLRLIRLPQQAIVHGDALCLSIAAASIVAKVTRDQMMCELDRAYPGYGFAQNKGYGTSQHARSLGRHGPSDLHRRSFAPVRRFLQEAG